MLSQSTHTYQACDVTGKVTVNIEKFKFILDRIPYSWITDQI